MSLFPRFVQSEFAPVFRLLDDYASLAQSRSNTGHAQVLRSFQPKFDVKETKEGYELKGEVPGIDQKDINIEFTDTNTLSIKGRREEGTRPSALVEGQTEQAKITEDQTNGYHKAAVEDEDAAATTSDASPAITPATTAVDSEPGQVDRGQSKSDGSKFWLHERSIGEFSRTFSFPNRIDQDSVTASLKDGILSIAVPKAPVPENKRISIL